MLTPFEELEYLADYLPEEGESILVTRAGGELHCEPYREASLRDGVEDPALYGLLVRANERLNARAALPLWACGVGLFWAVVAIFAAGGLGWESWFLVPGLGLVALWSCFLWIRARQRQLFTGEIRAQIESAIRCRGIDANSLLGGIRQHPELRTLLDEYIQAPAA